MLQAKPVKKIDVAAIKEKFGLNEEDATLDKKVLDIFEKQEEDAGTFYSIVNNSQIQDFVTALQTVNSEFGGEKKANCVQIVQTQ